ncbi:Exonuclease SbcC [Actinacidiphila bryophytorum]|uniref:Exonuclease SbcC n=1 Tax=Actinacidiphila bryophytorum TaxID=1436133 RepID=A0A9W4E5L9_9ACTN|nr:Exonuclease SbcC [Actinacidiphila bryophytorum]
MGGLLRRPRRRLRADHRGHGTRLRHGTTPRHPRGLRLARDLRRRADPAVRARGARPAADRGTGPGTGLPALPGLAPRQPPPGAGGAARAPALRAVRPLGPRNVDAGVGVGR